MNIQKLLLPDGRFLLLFCYRHSNYTLEKSKSNPHILHEGQHSMTTKGHKARGNLVLMACTGVNVFYKVLESLK